MSDQSKAHVSGKANWKYLLFLLKKRLLLPWSHTTFTIYFAVVLILLGGMGVWVPIYQNYGKSVSLAEALAVPNGIATYLIAVIAAAFADILLTDAEKKPIRIFSYAISVVALILGVLCLFCGNVATAYCLSVPGSVLSLMLWCIVNAEESTLQDPPPPTASTGGDVDKPLPGNLDGISA